MTDGATLSIVQRFEVIYCYSCRCPFAVPADIRARWREDGANFYCPNGHVQHYTESDIQRLQKQLEREKRDKEWAQRNAASEREARERTERRLSAANGAKTKLRNRIKNGVCPCCTRSFTNLAAHMKTKHPEFQPDEEGSQK